MRRVVLHVDMDAFFAAIEERDYPEFRGFPIIVGADPKGGVGRGVVSTANYAAREYGVHSAQPISQAWRCCQEGERRSGKKCVFFRGNFEKYERESQKIMGILRCYAEKFEQVGVDEAYLQLKSPNSKIQKSNKSQTSILNVQTEARRHVEALAQKIKKEILSQTQLTCSIGIGPNKLVAKIASDAQKPDGLTLVSPENVQKFLDPLSVRVIPGIGPKAEKELGAIAVKTIKDLRNISREKLVRVFGAWGEDMFERAQGKNDRVVGEEPPMKSIGREHTFAQDVRDPGMLFVTFKELVERVGEDIREENVAFQKVGLKVRFANFQTKTRQVSLARPTTEQHELEKAAMRLFLPFLDSRENPHNHAIRLLGIRVEKSFAAARCSSGRR